MCIYIYIYIYICHSGDEIKEMDRACGTDESQESYIQDFGVETRGKEDHLEDLDVDEMIILRWIFRKWDGGH